MNRISIPFPNNPFLKLLLFVSSFVFAIAFIPVIGSICLFFLPMILFLNGTVNERMKTATAFLISFSLLFLLSMLLHLNLPTIAIFTMGMAGLCIAQIAAQNGSVEKVIIYPALFIIAAICFYFIYSGFMLSVNPWEIVEKYIAAAIGEFVKQYSQLPLKVEEINLVKDNEKNMIYWFTLLYPSLIIITSALIIWANFLLGKQILGKAGITWPKLTALARWKAPDFIIWVFIVSGALILLFIISGGLFFVPDKDLFSFSLNIFLVVCLIYFLQGLAIVSFLFQSKNVPLFFRYIFYFLIAVQQFLMIPIVAVGLFDIWIDFRKFFQKDQTTT